MTRFHTFPEEALSAANRAQAEAYRRKQARREIVGRHGRRWRSGPKRGQIMFCTPSAAELSGAVDNLGSAGKIIYDTLEIAQLAAAELLDATGADMKPYPCPRSRHGHHHLTHAEHRTWGNPPESAPRGTER